MPRRLLALFLLVALSASGLRAADYKIDRNHSNIGFSVPILEGLSRVHGKFTDFTVELKFDAADLAHSSIRAVIKVASIDTGIADRDAHLRTADFFDAEKFPEAVFESHKIEATDNGFVARGKFTLHGITKDLDLPFTLGGQLETGEPAKRLENRGFYGRCIIDRRDFGITWVHNVDPRFVGNAIEIELSVLARRALTSVTRSS
jgi:polyisoprenoid-binding protein YceI